MGTKCSRPHPVPQHLSPLCGRISCKICKPGMLHSRDLPAVSDVLRQLLLLAGLVRAATAEADLGNPHLLADIARVAVWAFAIVVAVNQLGIARELVNTLFMATVGAVALALGLAFG